jgi:hypothetical protein
MVLKCNVLNSYIGWAFSLSIVKMLALDLLDKYKGNSAATSFILAGSLASRLSPLQDYGISAEGTVFQHYGHVKDAVTAALKFFLENDLQ